MSDILNIKDKTTNQWVSIPAIKGQDGKTAYEYAVDGGYTGTEIEFSTELSNTSAELEAHSEELSRLWLAIAELKGEEKTYPLIDVPSDWYVSGSPGANMAKSAITKITILDNYTATNTEDAAYPLTNAANTVRCYRIGTEMIIAGDGSGKIKLGENAQEMFKNFTSLEEIVGLELLDVSDVTALNAFFKQCPKLKSIDISFWDCVRVTTIQEMFLACSSIESIKMPQYGWNNITDITKVERVFKGCMALKEVDLGRGLKYIGNSCFIGCVTLKEIRGTEDIIEVDSDGFKTCFELEDVGFMKKLKKVGDAGFALTGKLNYSGIRPKNITSLGKSAFRASSIENTVSFDGVSSDSVGKLATRSTRWASPEELKVIQDGERTFPQIQLTVRNPQAQLSYSNIEFAKTTIDKGGCGPMSLFHAWQVLHPEASNEEIDFENWYNEKLGGADWTNKYDFYKGAYGGEMTYTIVTDINNYTGEDKPTLGLTMSKKFSPLEIDRIRQALEEKKPLLCMVPGYSISSNGKHMVVLVGYNKDTNRAIFVDSGWQGKGYFCEASLEDFLHHLSEDDYSKIYIMGLAKK